MDEFVEINDYVFVEIFDNFIGKFSTYFFNDINMFISSAVMSALFFGGFNFPGMDFLAEHGWSQNIITIIGCAGYFGKIIFFIFFFMWVRWTLPRFRYDQLMNLGWKSLIPIALLNLAITAAVMVIRHSHSFGF